MAKKSSKLPRIVVVGSSNTDMVVQSQRLPAPGETVIGGTFMLAAGGKGANQAVAAARLGANVTFVAKVGNDMFGDQAIAGYKKEGINTDYIFRDANNATGVALILVDAKGENLISVASGANGLLSPDDIEKAGPAIRKAGVVVVQLETPFEVVIEVLAQLAGTSTRAILAATDDTGAITSATSATTRSKKRRVPLILNPAPAPDEPLPPELLRYVTCITPNENEAERLTGIKVTDVQSALKAADRLLELGVKSAIITLGGNGCLVVEEPGKGVHVLGYEVKAVDTTAAGDAFNGALAFGIGLGFTLQESARLANVVAALSVTRLGAQPSLPTKADVEAF